VKENQDPVDVEADQDVAVVVEEVVVEGEASLADSTEGVVEEEEAVEGEGPKAEVIKR
jgi:hypothetical protein